MKRKTTGVTGKMTRKNGRINNMRAFSLFSGVGGFDRALEVFGVEIIGHSEIDPGAEKIYQAHFNNPNYGDIVKIDASQLPDFDILTFGSPCTDLSIANSKRTGLAGSRSGLFWEAIRILRAKKPKIFVMENVSSMSQECKKTISSTLGIEAVDINSALLTAQNRRRSYWVGRLNEQSGLYEQIPISQPEDRHISLSDIMESEVDEKYYIKNQSILIDRLLEKHSDKMEQIGKIARERGGSASQADRIYAPEGKSASLTALAGGLGAKTGLSQRGRYNADGSTSQNLEPRFDGKTNSLTSVQKDNLVFALTEARTEEAREKRRKLMEETGRDYCSRRDKELVPRLDGKANCLTASVGREHLLFEGARIRRLVPVETEKLQGFPSGWTDCGVSESARYRAMGNAVTVPVIVHILSHIPELQRQEPRTIEEKILAEPEWENETYGTIEKAKETMALL